MAEQRTVFFINNNGGGFAQCKTVEAGMTIAQFIDREVGGDPSGYLVRVNGVAGMQADYLLQDKDRVSCTPTKIAGAK